MAFVNLPGAKQRLQMFLYELVRIMFYHPIVCVVFFPRSEQVNEYPEGRAVLTQNVCRHFYLGPFPQWKSI